MLSASLPPCHTPKPANTASQAPRFGRVASKSNPLAPMQHRDPTPMIEEIAATTNTATIKPVSTQSVKASWTSWFSGFFGSVSKAVSTPVSAAAGTATGAATFSWKVFTGFVTGILDPQTWKTVGVHKTPIAGKHFPSFPIR